MNNTAELTKDSFSQGLEYYQKVESILQGFFTQSLKKYLLGDITQEKFDHDCYKILSISKHFTTTNTNTPQGVKIMSPTDDDPEVQYKPLVEQSRQKILSFIDTYLNGNFLAYKFSQNMSMQKDVLEKLDECHCIYFSKSSGTKNDYETMLLNTIHESWMDQQLPLSGIREHVLKEAKQKKDYAQKVVNKMVKETLFFHPSDAKPFLYKISSPEPQNWFTNTSSVTTNSKFISLIKSILPFFSSDTVPTQTPSGEQNTENQDMHELSPSDTRRLQAIKFLTIIKQDFQEHAALPISQLLLSTITQLESSISSKEVFEKFDIKTQHQITKNYPSICADLSSQINSFATNQKLHPQAAQNQEMLITQAIEDLSHHVQERLKEIVQQDIVKTRKTIALLRM